MFEISAKAYCDDHGEEGKSWAKDPKGNDKNLASVLKSIKDHLTKKNLGKEDPQMLRDLHGAITVLATPSSLLSVTSMNQLVHNSVFSVSKNDICSLFRNIFPFLEAMNR
jgi:hypothetical protein